MHIALFMPTLGGGGAERVSLTLAGSFALAGYRVSLVVGSAQGTLSDQIPLGVELIDLNADRVRRSLIPLVRWLTRHQPDALLASQGHANIVAFIAHRLSRSSARLILREDSTPSRNLAGMRRVPRWVLRSLLSMAYSRADAIVAVSRDAGDDLQRFLGMQLPNMVVIYNPVISKRLFELARLSAEHRWLADGGAPVVLSVGRLSKEKDYATLLRAFADLQLHPDARLIILGEGSLRDALEELVSTLRLGSRVSMPGFVSNPYAYMARAQLFVLSSQFEGLPGVLIEALACGCQVVSTDCPSGPREILRGGELGRLVPVGDVEALRRAIDEALRSTAMRVDTAHLQPYTEEHSLNAYLDLIRGESTVTPSPPGHA
jgi:glycosyltransferase involved in cell wall biosynthesis